MASQNNLMTAHIVVQFADAADAANVVAEIDDREDGYNYGKTTFYVGDTPHILLFLPTGYVVDTVISSAGSVYFVANSTKSIETLLVFPNEDQASLTYPVSDNWAYSWLGTSLGTLSVSTQFAAKLPARTFDSVTKKPIPEYRVGVASVTYTSACKVYRLASVPALVSQVIVYFVVKKIP